MTSRPSVLFVCIHNAGRSQMAAGFLRALASDAVEVRSAGSDPGPHINPAAVEAMAGGEQFRRLIGNIDADFGHRLDGGRVDVRSRVAAGRADLDGITGQRAQEPGGHLRPAGIVNTDE